MVFGLLIGIGVSVVNTRLLGPQQYGDLKFLQNLFAFVVSFMTFGIFVSGSRLLAQSKNEAIKNQLIGNLLILAGIISALFIIGLFTFSFFEEQIFHNELGWVIKIFSPLLFVFPLKLCLENIMQGDNRIYELSVFGLAPRVLYFLSAITFNYFVPLSLISSLAIQLGTVGIIILMMTIRFKPEFTDVKRNVAIIWEENKKYGFHVYLGSLANVTTAYLAGISVAFFVDNKSVGFFALALTISMPLTMIPTVVGTTLFKEFANRNTIPKNITVLTLCLSLLSFLMFILFLEKIVLFLYSHEYYPVITLAYIVGVGCFFRGLGAYFNKFLGAHGKGKEMRNGAIADGIFNVFGYFFLVKFFGVKGAAATKIISDFLYMCLIYYYYIGAKNRN